MHGRARVREHRGRHHPGTGTGTGTTTTARGNVDDKPLEDWQGVDQTDHQGLPSFALPIAVLGHASKTGGQCATPVGKHEQPQSHHDQGTAWQVQLDAEAALLVRLLLPYQ